MTATHVAVEMLHQPLLAAGEQFGGLATREDPGWRTKSWISWFPVLGAQPIYFNELEWQRDKARIDAFCDRLRLFRLGWSWAGPISLCAPYNVSSIRTQEWPHKGGLVRFAIGLEAVEDLRADLAQALATLNA